MSRLVYASSVSLFFSDICFNEDEALIDEGFWDQTEAHNVGNSVIEMPSEQSQFVRASSLVNQNIAKQHSNDIAGDILLNITNFISSIYNRKKTDKQTTHALTILL